MSEVKCEVQHGASRDIASLRGAKAKALAGRTERRLLQAAAPPLQNVQLSPSG